MAYISSNYVSILFVCVSAVISSECEIQQKNDAFFSVYNVYHQQPKFTAVIL